MMWLMFAAAAASLLMTAALRCYALSRSLLDIPNSRSSHTLPTPRGGGLAFVAAFMAGALCLGWVGAVDTELVIGVVAAGSLVALIGFMDDHGRIAARWRLLGHFLAAGWGLYWFGGMPPLLYLINGQAWASWLPLLLAVTVAGFLFWNLPPARIFMGDSGSGFLCIIIGLLAWLNPLFFWGWLILFGCVRG